MPRIEPPTPARGAGQRAGLDVDQIVATARSIDFGALTMQEVANRLGVDRKALNHYVRNREGLLDLVARDAFASRFEAANLASAPDWQSACRAYAAAFSDSMIRMGRLAESFQPGASQFTGIFAPTEVLLQKLTEGGFSDEQASQSVMLLTFICTGYARNATATERVGEHVGLAQLRRALAASPDADYHHLQRMADPSIDTSGAGMLETSLEVFLTGCEAMLTGR